MKTGWKTIAAFAAGTALVTVTALAQAVTQYSVKNLAPSVVKTVPEAGSTDVDAGLTEVTVKFSKDMADGSWSVPQTTPGENFPEINGKIHYSPDKRTCVIPVKLQPGRTYVLWFNHGQFMNFRDAGRHSAVPYLLVFETKQ